MIMPLYFDPEVLPETYPESIGLGAIGGKIVGAGGGGFILIIADPSKHELLLKGLGLEMKGFKFTQSGSRVIFVGEK